MNIDRTTRIIERLRGLASELSGYDEEEFVSEVQFVELGFDSLFLTQLSQAFKDEFGVEITFRDLLDQLPTLQAVADHIARSLPEDEAPSEPAAPTVAAGDPGGGAPAMSAPTPAPLPTFDRHVAVPASVRGSLDSAAIGSLGDIMLEQLRLMTWQLDLLQGGAPASVQREAPAPAVVAAAEAPAGDVRANGAAEGSSDANDDSPSEMTREIALSSGPPRGAAKRDNERMTPHQEKRLKDLIQRYVAHTAGSKRLTQSYRNVHADPRTAAGFNPLWKEIVYPLVVKRSLGSKLWDVDDNEYIDLLNGFGPNMFGYSAPFVLDAIRAQLERGFEVGPQTPLAGETAALVCELTGMDRATFVCTGSEAVQAAIRAARTHTGRTRIVMFEGAYHGNFDAALVRAANRPGRLRTMPGAPGIPAHAVEDVVVLPYGAPDSLQAIRDLGDQIAAVLVEPVQSRRPDLQPGAFLQELRTITRENGSVLVFDEVVTGFRSHPGGAQAIFGVEADLATYGKVIGGGLPIGVVAGRNPFMDVFDGGTWDYGDDSFPAAGVTFFAGTFVRHPLAIAAAHACLTYLKAAGPSFQARLNQATEQLAGRLNDLFERTGTPLRVPHFASIMYIRPEGGASAYGDLFFTLLRLHGVMAASGYPSYLTAAHTSEDIDRVVGAFSATIEEMQEATFFPSPIHEGNGKEHRLPAVYPEPVRPSLQPPMEGARLGRSPDGSPAWFVPHPEQPNSYLRIASQEVTG